MDPTEVPTSSLSSLGDSASTLPSSKAFSDSLLPPQREGSHIISEGSLEPTVGNIPPSCDWSQLPQDLLIGIFSRLELPDLVCSGAVCMSWNSCYLATRRHRLCSPHQSPYLVYSSNQRDGNTVTMHNLSTNKTYHMPVPDPPFPTRYIVGSSHGWLITADEQSSLHMLNPVTATQIALPPPESMKGVNACFNEAGQLIGHRISYLSLRYRCVNTDVEPQFFPPNETRNFLYQKVVLSSDPSSGNCTVVLKHRPWQLLSFARLGDTKWTRLDAIESCFHYHDVFYNDRDSMFYAIRNSGEIHAIDLNDQSPVIKAVLNVLPGPCGYTKYILSAPWGDLLQVNRIYGDPPMEDAKLGEEFGFSSEEDDNIGSPIDKLAVHRIDLANQKLTEVKSLQDHSIFIGFNTAFMLHARDFPNLSPNSLYITDDNIDIILTSPFRRRFAYLNLEDASLNNLSSPQSLLQGHHLFGLNLTLPEGTFVNIMGKVCMAPNLLHLGMQGLYLSDCVMKTENQIVMDFANSHRQGLLVCGD